MLGAPIAARAVVVVWEAPCTSMDAETKGAIPNALGMEAA
jgi:hypothetical protein